MRGYAAGVKSGDEAKLGTLRKFLVDDVLGVIEAASALDLAAEAIVGALGRPRALCRGVADFIFSQPIADADDHRD